MWLTKIGRYQIIEELGRGAMGVVYRGFDPTIGRTVAIKTLQLDTCDPELLARFRREAQTAGVLSHPNIVTIYDAGEDGGVFYIAMELVEGETLRKILVGGPLPVERTVRLVEQMGAALDYAHGHYIVHRDIKPANIVVSNDHVKVMDFGVAKITGVNLTVAGQMMGTPAYMAPEVVKGGEADGRADIFSLGVVLYEMLTGAKPFGGHDITTVIYKIMEAQPEAPAALNSLLDAGLNYVALKALAKEPAERYQTCAELIADLRNYRAYQEAGRKLAGRERTVGKSVQEAGADTATGTGTVLSVGPPPCAPPSAEALESGKSATPQGRAPRPAVARVPQGSGELEAPTMILGRVSSGKKKWIAAAGIVVALALAGGGVLWKTRRPTAVPSRKAGPAALQPTAGAQSALAPAAETAAPSGAVTAAPAEPSPGKPAAASPKPEIEFQVSATANPASIRIDGRERPDWQTPHRFKLPIGKHSIEVRKEGYRPARQEVEFTRSGPRSLVLELAPLLATVQISTIPPAAEVYIDGQLQPAATPSAYSVSQGRHKIELRKPGYQAVERILEAGEATPPAIRALLVPEPGAAIEHPARQAAPPAAAAAVVQGAGRVSVHTNPQGASISVDGKPTQYRTPVNFALPAGKHTITVERRGYSSETQEITVGKDAIVNLQLDLTPAGEKRRRFLIR
jgi:hypothetical protein